MTDSKAAVCGLSVHATAVNINGGQHVQTAYYRR